MRKYLISSALLIASIFGTVSMNTQQAQAQVLKLPNEIYDFNTRRTIEVNYHSRKIRHLRTNTKAYFDVILRRKGKKNSQEFSKEETPLMKLVIERNGTKKVMPRNFGLPKTQFYDVRPTAFSPDGRYLIVTLGVLQSDGYALLVLDSQRDYKPVKFNSCPKADSTYKGFISTSRIVFECSNLGPVSHVEIVNLRNKSISRRSVRSARRLRILPKSWNTVAEPRVIKTQYFNAKSSTISSNSQFPTGKFRNRKWEITLWKRNARIYYQAKSRTTPASLYLDNGNTSGTSRRKIYTWKNGIYSYQVIWRPNDPNYIRLRVFTPRRELLNQLLYRS